MTIKTEHVEEILREMFRLIGEDFSWEKTKEPNWFSKRKFPSCEAQWEFNRWLARFLVKKRYSTKSRAVYEASKIDCNYGFVSADGWLEHLKKNPVTP